MHVWRVLLGPDRESDPHDASARRIAANDSSEHMQPAEAFQEESTIFYVKKKQAVHQEFLFATRKPIPQVRPSKS